MSPSSPHTAFANRLQLICDEAGVPEGRYRIAAVAKRFDVSRETARLWFAGRVYPELSRLIEMAKEYHCSLDWLVTGREPASRSRGTTSSYRSLSSQERHVIMAMRELPPKRRAGLVAFFGEQ